MVLHDLKKFAEICLVCGLVSYHIDGLGETVSRDSCIESKWVAAIISRDDYSLRVAPGLLLNIPILTRSFIYIAERLAWQDAVTEKFGIFLALRKELLMISQRDVVAILCCAPAYVVALVELGEAVAWYIQPEAPLNQQEPLVHRKGAPSLESLVIYKDVANRLWDLELFLPYCGF